jgi:hypothetical protein
MFANGQAKIPVLPLRQMSGCNELQAFMDIPVSLKYCGIMLDTVFSEAIGFTVPTNLITNFLVDKFCLFSIITKSALFCHGPNRICGVRM